MPLALMQYDWCPYEKRELEHRLRDTRDACVQRDDHMKSHPEGGRPQAKERSQERPNQPHLDLGLLDSRNKFLLFQPHRL